MRLFLLLFTCCSLAIVSEAADCSDGYDENRPLVVVSMDGFRAEYLSRGFTPNIQSVIDRGVSAPYMVPSYPSKTFPNHYTIVTGLYPESHGIIANYFYDPTYGDFFSTSTNTSLDGEWWGGNPIWNTVTDQGKMSAAMFWTGSDADIEGKYPTYWKLYDGGVSYEARVAQVLAWLNAPVSLRPQWICVYFEQPDTAGHKYGPNNMTTMADALTYIDGYIGDLIDGIEDLNLTDCVNLMLVSDHGMTDAGQDKVLLMEEYLPTLGDHGYFFLGTFARIEMYNDSEALKPEVMQNISCQDPALRQYDPLELPKRLHFVNNIRIEDIVLDLDPGYSAEYNSDEYYSEGEHGYDNTLWDIQTIFAAAGPDFKVNYVSEPFQNIELYNLMCYLMDIDPSPNNGTEGSLYHLLANPPPYPTMPTENRPDAGEFPDQSEITERLAISECDGDLTQPEPWLSALDFSTTEQLNLEAYHLPWGLPYTGALGADILLLHQQDHVTGYSQTLKMPLWTSFTLDKDVATPGTPITEWSSDVRLNDTNTATCTSYDSLQSQNITQAPLFRPGFSINQTLDRIPFIISNSVPMSFEFETRWSELQDQLIPCWFDASLSDLNVITGPVFDSDGDSFVDDFTSLTSTPQPASDYFAILTRCTVQVTDLSGCSPTDLETIGFIYHDGQIAPNCLSRDRYAQMFSCKIRDVEKATGLTFFSDLSYQDANRLAIWVQREIWDHNC